MNLSLPPPEHWIMEQHLRVLALIATLVPLGLGCEESGTPPEHPKAVDDMTPDPDTESAGEAAEKDLGSGSGRACAGTLMRADLPAPARARIGGLGHDVEALAISPDGAWLASAAAGEVCLRRLDALDQSRVLVQAKGPVHGVGFAAGGTRLVSAGADGIVRVHEVSTGREVAAIDQAPARKRRSEPPKEHAPSAVLALASDGSGQHFITGGWDGRVRLHDGASGTLVRELGNAPFAVTAASMSPDGARVAVAAGASLDIDVYELADGGSKKRASGLVEPARDLAFVPDGAGGWAGLLAIDQEGKLIVFPRQGDGFDAGTYVGLDALADARHLARVDGRRALVTSGSKVLLVDLQAGAIHATWTAQTSPVNALAVSPGHGVAVSGGRDEILVWSLTSEPSGAGSGSGSDSDSDSGSGASSIPDAYRALEEAGCDPVASGVATPLEARVLRNVPYAMAGRPFKSVELTQLFSSDGDWYKPGKSKDVKLDNDTDACIATLKSHEKRLRKDLSMDGNVEGRLTASRDVFLGLRRLARKGVSIRRGVQRASDDQIVWDAPCAKGCKRQTIVCDIDPGSGDPTCTVDRR